MEAIIFNYFKLWEKMQKVNKNRVVIIRLAPKTTTTNRRRSKNKAKQKISDRMFQCLSFICLQFRNSPAEVET